MRYIPVVMDWTGDPDVGYIASQPDLVLAIAGKETFCDHTINLGPSGVGLMAVVPQPWTTTADRLLVPHTNVYYGMWILDRALQNEEHNPDHDLRIALAAYNCGWRVLDGYHCGGYGGFTYADNVLNFWLPRIQAALDEYTGRDFHQLNRITEQSWLRRLGFGLPVREPRDLLTGMPTGPTLEPEEEPACEGSRRSFDECYPYYGWPPP